MTASEDTHYELLKRDLNHIKEQTEKIYEIIEAFDEKFVSRREFDLIIKSLRKEIKPMQQILYGMVSIILVGVVGALISLVITK